MAITFTEPGVNAPFGPGFLVHVSTDTIGPMPSGTTWEISLLAADGETILNTDPPIPFDGVSLFTTFGVKAVDDWRWNPAFGGMQHLADGFIHAKLSAPIVGLIEEDQQAIKQDMITGMAYIQTALLSTVLRQLKTNTGNSGTIEADVAAIKAASFAEFGTNLIPISQLLQAPPLGFLHREQIEPDRTGEGELTRPVGPVSVDAFGLAWEFVDVAEGIGVQEGAPDRLVTRALELNTVHQLGDSSNENSFTAAFDYGDSFWLFPQLFPTVVRYWIGPGITVRFFWLVV